MASYGSHESSHIVEMEEGREVEFQIALECTALRLPSKTYGLPEDCCPAENAEFELESVHILDDDGKLAIISKEAWMAYVGADAVQKMIEAAELNANESGDF